MSAFNMDLPTFILRGIAIIISLSIHEYAHAVVSSIQGDDTPKHYGRLTANPLAHVDIMGLVALYMFSFGWAKPVPINPSYYKNERLGVILTSVAGPLSNLLLSFMSVLVFILIPGANPWVKEFLGVLFSMNIGLAIFNLLPFPPLDGSKIFAELFRGRIGETIYRMDRYGVFILFIILWVPQVNAFVGQIKDGTAQMIINIAYAIVNR